MRKPDQIKIFFLVFILLFSIIKIAHAQSLESDNYKIVDTTIDSGGGVLTGTNYDMLVSAANVGADTKLESSSYRLRSGFPNGIQANVPKLNCFETNTNSGTTSCLNLPNANGMVGECGETGCYNRAKLEIDDQNNPIDTLYLVAISPDAWTTVYYLQSDHSIGSSLSINNYMTQCELEGIDSDNSDCDASGDAGWNQSLQRYNVLGLKPDTNYQVMVRAVQGDFTETQYSQPLSAATNQPTISLDIDVDITDTETSAPHSINLGMLSTVSVNTAEESIWVDIGSNSINGVNVYVNDTGSGLYSALSGMNIPSESEDLTTQDGDGGFGLKTTSTGETSLGPLLSSSTFTTIPEDGVGGLTITPNTILYTNSTGSNNGPILEGRGRIRVKARSYTDLAAGNYTDTITFTALGNW